MSRALAGVSGLQPRTPRHGVSPPTVVRSSDRIGGAAGCAAFALPSLTEMPDEDATQTGNADTGSADETGSEEDGAAEPFDAVQAAAELAAALGRDAPAADQADPKDAGNYTAILEDEIESLQALVAAKDAELAEKDARLAEKEEALKAAHNKVAEKMAEIDRVRARLDKRAKETIERNRRSVIASFFDVADNLDRAAAEFDAEETVAPAFAQGVQAVQSELHNVLRQHGAKHRPSLGELFDPTVHEAVGTAPATDQAPHGTIAAVLREGYDLDDQPLRAARVIVAKLDG